MDAFELLKSDHEKVSKLFEEIESASGQGKRKVFAQLKGELDIHAHIEEKILYPALENTEEAREITLEAYEEHKVVKELLAELAAAGTPSDEWDAKLTVLKENVEHHVEEEEGDLFGKAREALSSEEIDRIGVELEAEKARQQGATVKTKGAASVAKGRSSQAAKKESKKSTRDQSGSKSRRPSKDSESPGVLKRIANFIGLGESSAASTKTTKKAGKSKPASKASGGSRVSAGSKAAKGKPAKSRSKSAAKKSVSKTTTTRKTKTAGKTEAASKANTGRANKRQNASGARRASTKAAPRSAGSKKGKGSTSTKRSKAR
jgi:iron-sulfur cluster repair protein YtfE (RIC family)